MSEMALVIPIIIVTVGMAIGTVLAVGRLVRQREQMNPVRETATVTQMPTREVVKDEDMPLAA